MNTPLRILLTGALLCAVGAGGYWLGKQQGVSPSVSAVTAGNSPTSELARLQSENQRLRAENETRTKTKAVANEADPQPASPAELKARIDQLNVLAEVQEERLGMIRIPMINASGRLTDGFTMLFGIGPQEQRTLQAALDEARERTDKLVTARATVEIRGDTLVATIPPFEGGPDIYDAVMDAFSRTLGRERYAAFLTLGAEQLGSSFNGFGAEQRTITVFQWGRDESHEPALSVSDERKSANGGKAGSGFSVPNVKAMVERYPWLAPYADKMAELSPRPIPQRPAPKK